MYKIFNRFTCAENKATAKELMRNYDDNVMGQVMSKFLRTTVKPTHVID